MQGCHGMQVTQVWEVKYLVSPTLNEPEEYEGFSFQVENNETFVIKEYQTTTTLEKNRIKSKLVKRSPPMKEISRDEYNIRKILLKRMVYTGAFSEILISHDLSLKNLSELEAEGYKITTDVRASLVQQYGLLNVENDNLSTTEQFWKSGTTGYHKDLDESILRISDWTEKSVAEPNPIKSFMLLWAAFNCLYDTFSKEANLTNSNDTFEKIRKSIQKLVEESDAINLIHIHRCVLNSLVSYNFIVPQRRGQTKDTPISRQLGDVLEKDIPPLVVLIRAMRCVYEIRNNVKHQGALIPNIDLQASDAKRLLFPITTTMLRNMVKY